MRRCRWSAVWTSSWSGSFGFSFLRGLLRMLCNRSSRKETACQWQLVGRFRVEKTKIDREPIYINGYSTESHDGSRRITAIRRVGQTRRNPPEFPPAGGDVRQDRGFRHNLTP